MKKNNNLDEMQEQELLAVEHNGCWLAFWGLLIAMIVQSFAFGSMDFRTLAGEWIVFMVLALYLAIACARRGIWDRKLEMNTKTNVIVSAVAAVLFGIFNAVMVFKNYHKPVGTIIATVIAAAITFILCLAALSIMMKVTQKRKAAMEEEPADADEV